MAEFRQNAFHYSLMVNTGAAPGGKNRLRIHRDTHHSSPSVKTDITSDLEFFVLIARHGNLLGRRAGAEPDATGSHRGSRYRKNGLARGW